jgi:hypothetical protein
MQVASERVQSSQLFQFSDIKFKTPCSAEVLLSIHSPLEPAPCKDLTLGNIRTY